jgi:hypothetical protein
MSSYIDGGVYRHHAHVRRALVQYRNLGDAGVGHRGSPVLTDDILDRVIKVT